MLSSTDPPADPAVLWKGMLAGALGGLIASWTMEQAQALLSQALGDGVHQVQEASGHPHEWDARSQDVVTGEERSAPARAADAMAEAASGQTLPPDERAAGGAALHYAFGAGVGALYGAFAEMRPQLTAGAGIPFGLALWATADEIGMSALSLAPDPAERPPRSHAYAIVSHIVYGATTELIRSQLRAQRRSVRRMPGHGLRETG
jgi:putative membrane protein